MQPRVDPVLSGLKRPGDEVFYTADIVPKRARVDSTPSLPVYPQRPGEKDCAFYMRTRTCSFGASCKYDHPTWVPAGGIPEWKEASAASSKNETLPVRPGELDCAFYMKTGICKYGLKCKFNHPEERTAAASDKKSVDEVEHENVKGASEVTAMGMPANDTAAEIIVASAANGPEGDANAPVKLVNAYSVKDGDAIAPIKLATAYNAKGLPIRPGETDCAFYMKTGSCKYGSTCRFNHPDKKPASVVAVQSQPSVASILGLSGSLGYPSVHAGALSDYGLSIPGLGFGVSALAQTSPYPQRPGENTCSYYMKTGICKFGSTCKFHHPVNRTDPSYGDPNLKLTLAGLPRHEGARSCPYYMKTGSCKYGLACKFDHPPPGEAAAMALAEAGKSEQNKLSDSDL